MGKHSKKEQNLKQCSHTKNEKCDKEYENQSDDIKFTIAIIYYRFPETDAREFAALIGKHPPSYYQITKAFNLLPPIFIQLARDSVLAEKRKMPQNSSICVDGSWYHLRDEHLHIFDVIYVQTEKIINFSIEIRISEKKKRNTNVSPQALEGMVLKEIIPRLMDNSNIIEIIKDGDVQLEAIIIESDWNVTVRHDLNHLLKHFTETF